MRKLLFFLLLIAGWTIIFTPLILSEGGLSFNGSSAAKPSLQPLPGAWQGSQRLQMAGVLGSDEGQPVPVDVACGSTYVLQSGESLGDVASLCGINLSDLIAANRQIANPNQVYAGQEISVPNPLVGRGGGDTFLAEPQPQANSLSPGAALEITADGLPPNTGVRIGIGLESSGYRTLTTTQTDDQGRIAVTVAIPFEAVANEEAFIQITTEGIPTIQRMSKTFLVGW